MPNMPSSPVEVRQHIRAAESHLAEIGDAVLGQEPEQRRYKVDAGALEKEPSSDKQVPWVPFSVLLMLTAGVRFDIVIIVREGDRVSLRFGL